MKCKFCQADLLDNSSVCPECGKDNLKDNLQPLKIVTLGLVCLVMLVLLAGLVCYGVTGSFVPWLGDKGDDTTTQTTAPTQAVSTDVTIITADGEKVVKKEELSAYMGKTAATMGEHTLKNSELQLYYWLVAYNSDGVDTTKSLTEQVYDKETGKTWHEYCKEEAIASWKEVMVMSDTAAKAEFKMPDAEKEYLDSMKSELEYYVTLYSYYGYNIANVDELLQMMYGPGITYDDYYNYCYNYYYGGAYWSALAEEIEVTDAELEDYFKENEESLKNDYAIPVTKDFGNLMDIRRISIDLITDKDTKEEDWEATLKAAQEIYDAYLAGEKTEESFTKLAQEKYAEDNDNGALLPDLYQGNLRRVDVRHILVMPEGGTKDSSGNTTYSEEEWKAALTEAEAILQKWLDGDKTEESFGELANEYSDDNNGNVTNGGIYTDVAISQMVAEFEAWCFDVSRQSGDYGIVKTKYGYHVMYYVRADQAVDDWVSAEDRVAGDVEMIKTDDGYQIVYFVAGEPAWIRYSRYGVQTKYAQEQLDALEEAATVSLNEADMIFCKLG